MEVKVNNKSEFTGYMMADDQENGYSVGQDTYRDHAERVCV